MTTDYAGMQLGTHTEATTQPMAPCEIPLPAKLLWFTIHCIIQINVVLKVLQKKAKLQNEVKVKQLTSTCIGGPTGISSLNC